MSLQSASSTKDEKSGLRSAINGAIAGIASRTISAPVDFLKIRFQLQTATLPMNLKYTSIAQAIQTILQEEGFRAFWKGNVSGLWLYSGYSAVQFYVYSTLNSSHNTFTLGPSFNGAAAATVATCLSYPFDLLRTRTALQGNQNKIYHSTWQALQLIIAKEGIPSLYRGMLPSLGQIVPSMAIAFGSFEQVKQQLDKQNIKRLNPTIRDFIAGVASGIIHKTILMPVDVVRKRLQIQGSSSFQAYAISNLPRYQGTIDAVQTIYRTEGWRGFYRGLSLALLKSVPVTATIFVTYGILDRIP